MSSSPAVERFRGLVARHLGLQFDEARTAWLAEVLSRRIAATGGAAEPYLARLEGGAARAERGALARELTVGETYFFRHAEQFEALRRHARQTCRSGAVLRVLSAGCASGEEPYSIAMTLQDEGQAALIRAVDLNPAQLDKARRARYSAWALRETPLPARQRWFRPEGRDWALVEPIRAAVEFEERNLSDGDPSLWPPGGYDVVFCRNVLMYLTPPAAEALVARIAEALVPGGCLFLGHAETLRGLSTAFDLRQAPGSFHYQRHSAGGDAPAAPSDDGTRWFEAIGQAAERVRTLADAVPMAALPARADAPRSPLGPALDLLRQERFADALGLVQALPAAAARDPEVLLLQAMLLAHGGELAEAEQLCRRLLAVDGRNAGAHHALALCREGAGDRPSAADCDRLAIQIDPAFALPRLHLGRLARRAGDRETARRELAKAAGLLAQEDPARLLLFGGGFDREALLSVCRAELAACGGTT